MRYFFQYLLLVLFLTLTKVSISQSNIESTDSLAGRFISDLRSKTNEQLLVHTNKKLYITGEEIWMKAWIVNSLSHKYYSHSKTLYIDLVNEKDSAVAKLLLNIPSERTEANIKLSDSLKEGYYWLRAYTAHMQKRDTNAISVTPLYIVNKKSPIAFNEIALNKKLMTSTNNSAPSLIIYPEGGELISGINSVVALKAVNKEGKPLKVEGYINDNIDTSALTWFKTDSTTGLDKVVFFVAKNKNYTANVKWGNQIIKFPLPLVNHYASQIAIKEQNASSIKLVISQGDSLYKKGKYSYLLGISRDSLCFASVGNDMFEVSVSKSNFPAGISKFLLFNENQEVVSERTVYIDKPKEDYFITTDKQNYKAREKVTLSINNGDSLLHPIFTALSVAVTDDNLIKELSYLDKEESLPFKFYESKSSMDDLEMLTAPLMFKGKSFNKESSLRAQLANEIEIPADTIFSNINGRILNKKNMPVSNRIVTLYTNKRFYLFDTDTTKTNGQFKFTVPPYLDSIPFIIQVANLKGDKVNDKIIIDVTSPFPSFSTPISLKKKLVLQRTDLENYFNNTKNFQDVYMGSGKEWLKSVIVKSSIKANSYYVSKRVSNFSTIMTGEALQKMNPNDASTGLLMIPGLHLRSGYLTLGGVTSWNVSEKDEPLLIVDGVMLAGGNSQQTDTDAINQYFTSSPLMSALKTISPDIIDFVEVLKGPEAAYYGSRAMNGVILVNTQRKSNFSSHYENYGVLQYYPASYHLAPLYNMPDYENLEVKNASFKDNRATLYWNGHLYSNAKGNAKIEFYTGDISTTYTITVTGITNGGHIIYKKTSFKRSL